MRRSQFPLLFAFLASAALARGRGRLVSVRSAGDAATAVIEVEGDRPLSFTTLKLPLPPRVVVDFADTETGSAQRELEVADGTVRRVGVAAAGARTARVVIELAEDGEFEVRASGNRVDVRVPRAAPRVAAAPPSEAEKRASLPTVALLGPHKARPPEPPSAVGQNTRPPEPPSAVAQNARPAKSPPVVARDDRREAAAPLLPAAPPGDNRAEERAAVAAEELQVAARPREEKPVVTVAGEEKLAPLAGEQSRATNAREPSPATVARDENPATIARGESPATVARDESSTAVARGESGAAGSSETRPERAAQQPSAAPSQAVPERREPEPGVASAGQPAPAPKPSPGQAEPPEPGRAPSRQSAEPAPVGTQRPEASERIASALRAPDVAPAPVAEDATANATPTRPEPAAAKPARVAIARQESPGAHGGAPQPARSRAEQAAPSRSITGIGFHPTAGGAVIVRSDKPLEYGVSGEENAVLIHLPHSAIARANDRRPLDTRVFGGPVRRVVPIPVSGGTDLRIELGAPADYRLEQSGPVLTISFALR